MSSIFCCKDINAITCNISRQCQNFINQFTLLLRKLKLPENIYLIFPNIKSWKIKKIYLFPELEQTQLNEVLLKPNSERNLVRLVKLLCSG